jgi:hypothetical protein
MIGNMVPKDKHDKDIHGPQITWWSRKKIYHGTNTFPSL